MGIKIIRLKGLHSKQKRFWDILQKPDFIIGDSYYDFQAFISRLHLIGSPPNWVWWTILSQLIFDLLWSKSEIPTISKIKAREGANFGFSRFQPCLFSQIWRGSRIWTIKRTFEMCQRRVTKKNFMNFWQRAAEIWDLKEGQNWDFSKSYISAALCQNFMNFFLVTLLLQLSIRYSLAMSRHLTVSEIKDMAETMEIQKCHFLWPCSLTWLGFRPWP